ncbi:hypothetical protein [Desulfoplanes formicivorans]|uniref:Cobalamin biosynthesis protein CbiL n=1 Tax=Desulfoplanes formicivorans TaxID=1592317 RepID=A0A194AFL5_9BACT|nr:hypothetical protein [Desulfoplanes formicivorans]GAU08867.1 hypothetical protein DPF_1584 [Desulfoplanes formicivorans]
MKQGWLVMAVVCVLVFGLGSSLAHAHRVGVFCWVEGNRLHTQSKFQPGGPVNGGRLQMVVPATGEVLATGTTDPEGQYTFRIPDRARQQHLDLRVLLMAGTGHKGQWDVPATEYVDGLESVEPDTRDGSAGMLAGTNNKMSGISPEIVQDILDRELDRKLAPIKRRLAQMQADRFSVRDVVGGLGYLFGLMGLALYCRSIRGGKDRQSSSSSHSASGKTDPS